MKLSTTQLMEILEEILGEPKPEELILSRYREYKKDNPDLLGQLFNLQWWHMGPWEIDLSLFGTTELDGFGSYKDLMLLKFFRNNLSHSIVDGSLNEDSFIDFFHNNDSFNRYNITTHTSDRETVIHDQLSDSSKTPESKVYVITNSLNEFDLDEIICLVMWPLFKVYIKHQKHSSSSPHLMEIALLYYIEGTPITPTNWEELARNAAFRFNLSKTPSKKIYYNYLDIQRRDNQTLQLFQRARALTKDEDSREKVDKKLAEYLEWKKSSAKGKAIK